MKFKVINKIQVDIKIKITGIFLENLWFDVMCYGGLDIN